MISLSYSSLRDWKKCRKLYFYRRILGIKRKRVSASLRKGTMVHGVLEDYLSGVDYLPRLKEYKKEFDKMLEEEKEYYGDLPGEVGTVISGYKAKYPDDPGNTLEVELAFDDVPISDKVALTGRIDWVFEDDRGVWVADHKTTSRPLPSETFRLYDLQTAIYSKIVQEMGYSPRGIVFNYIKTKVPTVPKVLKNGTLSRRKIITDEATWLKTILANGLNPRDYAEEIEAARKVEFFTRKFLPKPDAIVQGLMSEIEVVGEEILSANSNSFYRATGKECEMCEYFPVCMAELSGLDSEFLIKTEYEERRKGGMKLGENEGGN